MSKICKSCGGENPDSAIYCVQCNKMLNVLGGLGKSEPATEEAASSVESAAAPETEKKPSTLKQPKIESNDRANPPVAGAQFAVENKPSNKGKGCFFWGCLTFILFCVVIVGLAVGGVFLAREELKNVATQKPVTITEFTPTEAQTRAIRTKMDEFSAGNSKTISFSAIDLNTLIATGKDFEFLKGKVFFYINNGILRIKGAVPLDVFMLEGYYLSGRMDIKARTTNGKINIYVDRVEGPDGIITGQSMDELKKVNIVEALTKSSKDPKVQQALANLKEVTITRSDLVITLK